MNLYQAKKAALNITAAEVTSSWRWTRLKENFMFEGYTLGWSYLEEKATVFPLEEGVRGFGFVKTGKTRIATALAIHKLSQL